MLRSAVPLNIPHLFLYLLVGVSNYPFVWIVERYAKQEGVSKVYDIGIDAKQVAREKRNSLTTWGFRGMSISIPN
jgi:hypothetical protein